MPRKKKRREKASLRRSLSFVYERGVEIRNKPTPSQEREKELIWGGPKAKASGLGRGLAVTKRRQLTRGLFLLKEEKERKRSPTKKKAL